MTASLGGFRPGNIGDVLPSSSALSRLVSANGTASVLEYEKASSGSCLAEAQVYRWSTQQPR